MKFITPFDDPAYNYNQERRFKKIIKFMVYPSGNVLVVGGGHFEKMLEEYYFKIFDYHNNNLNKEWSFKKKYKTIFCFQVIEHLLNPLLLLEECRKSMFKDSLLYISYPIHGTKMFWGSAHFHEYDKSRFHYMIETAGFVIVKHESHILWHKIKGIRPIIRNTPIGWCINHYYELRIK